MREIFRASAVCGLLFIAAGCTTIRVSVEVQSGRRALEMAEPKQALQQFEAAAAANPNYTTRFTLLHTGIWTYIGKAQFALGEREAALASFKKAREKSGSDNVTRIYLGLLLVQTGNESKGKSELVAGLKGLATWLERLPGQGGDGVFWDPDGHIAEAISQLLKLVEAQRPDWQKIADHVVWLGNRLEEEIDNVKDDKEMKLLSMEGDSG